MVDKPNSCIGLFEFRALQALRFQAFAIGLFIQCLETATSNEVC